MTWVAPMKSVLSAHCLPKAHNLMDDNSATAWLEGAPDNGQEAQILFKFKSESPRVRNVIIIKGYPKTKVFWQVNNRVKIVEMYVNGSLYALFRLMDSRERNALN